MKKTAVLLAAILVLGGLTAWRLKSFYTAEAAVQQMQKAQKSAPPTVSVAPAVWQDIRNEWQAIGNVESPYNVNISSQIVGTIAWLQARQGDPVKAGETLVRIDPSQIEAQIAQDEANVAQAEQKLAQADITANAANVGVSSQIGVQKAALVSAEASRNLAEQTYQQQVSSAQDAVTQAQNQVSTAQASVNNASAGIRSAQASLNNAQASYQRTYSLYRQGYVAAQDVDNARTALQVAQAAVDTAQGQHSSALAQQHSAEAQLSSAKNQLSITVMKSRTDIDSAKAAVQQAQANLKLAMANRAQTPAYQANLRALRAAVAAAKAQLSIQKTELGYTTLVSPITGYVTARNADPGSTATVGEALLTVQQLSKVYLNVPVPEEQINALHVGSIGTASLDALPGQTFTGKIVYINPSADLQTRQYSVRIALNNPQGLIKPGMFATVSFVLKNIPHALTVPREAVQTGKDGAATVDVINSDNTVRVVPVRTGGFDHAAVQILSGIQPGDQVVVLSANPLHNGQKVRVAAQQKTRS